MRAAVVVIALALAAVVPESPAEGETGCIEVEGGRIRCGGERTGRERSDRDGGGGGGGGGDNERAPRGPGSGAPRSGRGSDGGSDGGDGGDSGGGGDGACLRDPYVIPRPDECHGGAPAPAPPAAPGAVPAPAVDPAVVAAEMATAFWHEVALAHPRPFVAPGWAITGKQAFLETRMPLAQRFAKETPLGPLRITSAATITVDWGDGTRTVAARTAGAPWPHGDLTHTWTTRGEVDVAVRAAWSARWSLGAFAGTLDRVTTSATLEDLPVREVQGLRTR